MRLPHSFDAALHALLGAKTKRAMAKELRTSRSQLDRLLDPRNASVTLDTITRAARALGKRVVIRIADVKAKWGKENR